VTLKVSPVEQQSIAPDAAVCRAARIAHAVNDRDVAASTDIALSDISSRILQVRGHRVLLDTDLAALYGVPAKRLNEQMKRNVGRFPEDFAFVLTDQEVDRLRSQFATLKAGRGQHRKHPPTVFTEHGALMAGTLLNSPRAVQMSLYVVRAFVRLRQLLGTQVEIRRDLDALKGRVETLDAKTRKQFDQVHEAILNLLHTPRQQ
jgi:hypothetical protein